MDKETIDKGRSIAITSYILIVGVLIALSINSENKNQFASFKTVIFDFKIFF